MPLSSLVNASHIDVARVVAPPIHIHSVNVLTFSAIIFLIIVMLFFCWTYWGTATNLVPDPAYEHPVRREMRHVTRHASVGDAKDEETQPLTLGAEDRHSSTGLSSTLRSPHARRPLARRT